MTSTPETLPEESLAELRALERPVLVRALICLVFGLVTVFWQQPGLVSAQWSVGIYMVALGGVLFWTQRRLNVAVYTDPGSKERSVIQSFAVLYALGGVLAALFVRSDVQLVLVLGLLLAIAGVTELLLGMRAAGSVMSKDWRIAGFVTLLAAVALFAFGEMGPKAVLGIVGASALIIGVFQVLAALSFRHDAAQLAARGTEGLATRGPDEFAARGSAGAEVRGAEDGADESAARRPEEFAPRETGRRP